MDQLDFGLRRTVEMNRQQLNRCDAEDVQHQPIKPAVCAVPGRRRCSL